MKKNILSGKNHENQSSLKFNTQIWLTPFSHWKYVISDVFFCYFVQIDKTNFVNIWNTKIYSERPFSFANVYQFVLDTISFCYIWLKQPCTHNIKYIQITLILVGLKAKHNVLSTQQETLKPPTNCVIFFCNTVLLLTGLLTALFNDILYSLFHVLGK